MEDDLEQVIVEKTNPFDQIGHARYSGHTVLVLIRLKREFVRIRSIERLSL